MALPGKPSNKLVKNPGGGHHGTGLYPVVDPSGAKRDYGKENAMKLCPVSTDSS